MGFMAATVLFWQEETKGSLARRALMKKSVTADDSRRWNSHSRSSGLWTPLPPLFKTCV
jgi:hypothetical protein